MELFLIVFVISLGAYTVRCVLRTRQDDRTAANIEKRIRRMDRFEPADVYVSPDNFAGIAIDVGRQELLLADESGLRRFTASSIVSCEILEDEIQLDNVSMVVLCL